MATATAPTQLSAAELVRTYQVGIWRYLRYLGADDALADDLTQETFLEVIRRPFAQHSSGETAAYLRTVARHKLLRAVEQSRRQLPMADLDQAEAVWARLAGESGLDDYLAALDECLAELDGRPRSAIQLRYRDGRSREEIACALSLSEEGVKTLLRRTREVLRRCIQGRIET